MVVCVCVCVCVRAHACVHVCMCVHSCVYVHLCVFGADRCIPLTLLVDVCQCRCLLMFVCLLPLRDTFLAVKLGE